MTLLAALALPMVVTVASFNVRFGTANDGANRWEVRRPRTIEAMRRNPAAIWALQEALDFQVEELARAIGGYRSIGVGRDDGRRAGEFAAILYSPRRFRALASGNFWLSDTPEVVASRSWGNQVVRICTWARFEDRTSGRTFFVFNTHLDHQSQPSREKGVALILRRIAERTPQDPVIVTGDLHAGEDNPAVEALRVGGFRDSFRVVNPDARQVGTFNGFGEAGEQKIDYVFVDGAWRVRAARIVFDRVAGFWPSDHMPVLATLELTGS